MPALGFPKPYADFVARLRVPAGFVLVAAFGWFSHPDARSLALGTPLALAGLALRAWAAGHLAKDQRLATSGPYAYMRNPLYVGTLMVAAGLAAASRSAGLALLFAAVFGLVYLPVVELEEQHLRKLFPEYDEYARRVPAFLPTFKPMQSAHPFRPALYLTNQEYQAAAGLAVGLLFLLWKSWRV